MEWKRGCACYHQRIFWENWIEILCIPVEVTGGNPLVGGWNICSHEPRPNGRTATRPVPQPAGKNRCDSIENCPCLYTKVRSCLLLYLSWSVFRFWWKQENLDDNFQREFALLARSICLFGIISKEKQIIELIFIKALKQMQNL